MITTRNELAILFKDLGFKVGAEIGVDRGLYAEILCQANPNVILYLVDPWKTYNEYADFLDQEVLDKNYLETINRLASFKCEIIRKSSMEAVKDFKPESLDFVYIDGNHDFKYVLEDLTAWSKIVKKGGIVSGHDYRTSSHSHGKWSVKRAVDKFVKENNKELILLVGNNGSSWMFYE